MASLHLAIPCCTPWHCRRYNRNMRAFTSLLALACVVAGEQVFEDSPALTALWEASSSGSTEAFINQLIQNREYGQHRASDGRGPMFWAYEFKNVDTLALLLHLGVSPGAVIVSYRPMPRLLLPIHCHTRRSSCISHRARGCRG